MSTRRHRDARARTPSRNPPGGRALVRDEVEFRVHVAEHEERVVPAVRLHRDASEREAGVELDEQDDHPDPRGEPDDDPADRGEHEPGDRVREVLLPVGGDRGPEPSPAGDGAAALGRTA